MVCIYLRVLKTFFFSYLDKTKNEVFILMEKRVSELYKKKSLFLSNIKNIC